MTGRHLEPEPVGPLKVRYVFVDGNGMPTSITGLEQSFLCEVVSTVLEFEDGQPTLVVSHRVVAAL